MFGMCLCCKGEKNLTRHHDKQIGKVVLICRDCHNIVEEYLKVQTKAKDLMVNLGLCNAVSRSDGTCKSGCL